MENFKNINNKNYIRILALWIFLFAAHLDLYSQAERELNKSLHISKTRIEIGNLLKQIEAGSNLNLTFSPGQIHMDKTIELDSDDKSLYEYLNIISKNENLHIVVNSNDVYLIKNYAELESDYEKISLSGFIKDSESGEVLIGASIRVEDSSFGKIADESGYFNISVPKGKSVVISYIGYTPLIFKPTDLRQDIKSDFFLKKSILLEEVIIKNDLMGQNLLISDFEASKSIVSIQKRISTIGSDDLFNELISKPGIEKINDFQGGVSVNGLNPGDNVYMIDGVRIYEPNHIFGLFSAFNLNAINKVSLFTNAIPVKYSGVFSSVINSHLKEGNFKQHMYDFSLSNTDVGIHLSGPILKYKTSYIVDFRKSILGLYIPKFIKNSLGFDFDKMDFQDVNVKISHFIHPGNKFNFFLYNGKDDIIINNALNKINSENNYSWKNTALGMRWSYLFSDKLKSQMNLSISQYSNNSYSSFELTDSEIEADYLYILSKTDIRDISLKHHFSYYLPNSILRFGYNFSKFNILPALSGQYTDVKTTPNEIIETDTDSIYYSGMGFLSGEYTKIEGVKIKAGFQYGMFNKGNYVKSFFNPQFSFGIKLGNNSYFDINYLRSIKYIHSLGSYTIGIPSMIWTGSDDNIPISYMNNYSIYYHYKIKGFELKSELYYKELFDILQYKSVSDVYNPISSKGAVIPALNSTKLLSNDIAIGSGVASGVNIYTMYQYSKLQAKFSFSINRISFKYPDINFGGAFPGNYDMLYTNSVSLLYKTEKLNLFVDWHFHSGQVFTLPQYSFLTEDGKPIIDFSERNNQRMSDYHSLSIGGEYLLRTKYIKWIFSTGISNVYNHFNPVYVYLYKSGEKYKASQVSGLPIFPYFKISAKF